MEEVLSKHRKRVSAETMMEGVDETDEEKMKHQLVLDVNGLLPYMNELKLPVPESYGELVKMVKSAYAKKKLCVCLHQRIFHSCPFSGVVRCGKRQQRTATARRK